jgi:prolyl oligopeptidase
MNRSARLALACVAALAAVAMDKAAPPTRLSPTTDTYFGVTEHDPYRWLEDGASPEVKAWSAAQDARTRGWLDKLPFRQSIHDRLMAFASQTSPSYGALYAAGGGIFALATEPPKQQPMIVRLGRDADPVAQKIVLDPNALDPTGGTEIDWFVPSPDGTKIAVSLSKGGSEDGTLHVYDVASGRQINETIPGVQYPTGGGSLAWRRDGSGFWYTRYPGAERPAADRHFYQEIYYHHLGDDPAKDAYVLGKNFPKIAEIALDNHENPNIVVASVANGDGGQFEHFLISPDNTNRQITDFDDGIVSVTAGADGVLYLTSTNGAPRGKLLTMPANDPILAQAHTLVPQSDGAIELPDPFEGPPVTVTSGAIYVRELVGGPSRVAVYDHAGKRLADLPLPPIAAVPALISAGDGTLLYQVSTYLRPPYFARFDEATGKSSESKLAETSPVSFGDTDVLRDFARSKDGTRIPVNIVRLKSARMNGANPTLLYGYGGFNISEVPHFLGAGVRLWLDAHGVYAIANVRGGDEYGADWHAGGALTHKQNVFDDFAAAAHLLIDRGYTSPAHLAALGGSNGGLLMGAEITQHPGLYHAVVSLVGIYDMLRTELDPNGAFNVTEYGSVTNEEQFHALASYSPYHHVVAGTPYPAIFMATGANDGRVNPAHSRKMVAALQAATSSGLPVLLSINMHAGHGIGSALSVRVDQETDWLSFLFDELGMMRASGGGLRRSTVRP